MYRKGKFISRRCPSAMEPTSPTSPTKIFGDELSTTTTTADLLPSFDRTSSSLNPAASKTNANAPAQPNALPEWLDGLKKELLATGEWGALVRDVYNGVTGRLEQNHIQFFSDLEPSEKSLFIDEVEKSLFSTPTYKTFQGMLSRALDHSLADAVDQDVLADLERLDLLHGATGSAMEDSDLSNLSNLNNTGKEADDAGVKHYTTTTTTAAGPNGQVVVRARASRSRRGRVGVGHKVDQILERASEGAVQLLQRLPNEKSTLRIMLNKEFPPKLRYQAWRLYLGHPEAREKYEKAIIVSRMSTISDQDAEISFKCQAILDEQAYQSDIMVRVPNPHTILVNMKTVLSYYQKVSNVSVVPEEYYRLAIPLVYVYGINYDKTASVIESFFGLLEMPRPKFMSR